MRTSAPRGGERMAPIGPFIPAPLATNHQLSNTSSATPAATISRSRRSNLLVRSRADDAMRREMKVRELGVFVGDLDLHRTAGGPAGGAPDLRNFIFEPVGQADLGAAFRAGHLVADRFARHLDIAGDAEP